VSVSEDVTKIARIVKSNGTNGEVLLDFRDISLSDVDFKEPVFIYFDGLPVPFFFESLIIRGASRAVAKLAGIDSFEEAEEVAGKAMYGYSEAYGLSEEREGWPSFAGWSLVDENGAEMGIISGMEDIPGNPCVYVDTKNGQAMVPLNERLILSADKKLRRLTMSIPAGLI